MTLSDALKPLFIGVALACGMYELTVNDKVLLIAEDYVGVTEIPGTRNRSPEMDYWNSRLGLPLGSSYCAAFASFVLDSAGVTVPARRSGVAQHFINNQSIPAARVIDGKEIPAGSLVIWKRGETWMGHVGFVREDWRGARGHTIEANTTAPGGTGDQRDGDGVWKRTRVINPTAYFRITHFTLIE